MSREHELLAALSVIALTPHIRDYLAEHDPKALKQVDRAVGEIVDKDAAREFLRVNSCSDFFPREKGASVVVRRPNNGGYAEVYNLGKGRYRIYSTK